MHLKYNNFIYDAKPIDEEDEEDEDDYTDEDDDDEDEECCVDDCDEHGENDEDVEIEEGRRRGQKKSSEGECVGLNGARELHSMEWDNNL